MASRSTVAPAFPSAEKRGRRNESVSGVGPSRDGITFSSALQVAAAFKDRIGRVRVGELLRVRTTDPSAKEDLPSLARLMGHAVRTVEARPDGSLEITVERRR